MEKKENTKKKKQYCSVKSVRNKGNKHIFWYFIGATCIISAAIAVFLVFI